MDEYIINEDEKLAPAVVIATGLLLLIFLLGFLNLLVGFVV